MTSRSGTRNIKYSNKQFFCMFRYPPDLMANLIRLETIRTTFTELPHKFLTAFCVYFRCRKSLSSENLV